MDQEAKINPIPYTAGIDIKIINNANRFQQI